MSKFFCFLFGHKKITSKCPVTGIELSTCSRCEDNKHPRGMTFN